MAAGIAWLAVFGHRGLAPCAGMMALMVAFRRDIWRAGFGLLAPQRELKQSFFGEALSIASLATAAFVVVIALTAFWSPTPGAQWLALTIASAVLVGGALVYEAVNAAPARARCFAILFALMVSPAAALLMFEGLSGGYLRGVIPPDDASPERWKDMTALARGVTAIAPLVFPAAILIRRLTGSWTAAFAPAAAAFIAATHFSVFANVVAIAAGAVAFFAAMLRPRSAMMALAILFAAALILTPFVASALPLEALFDNGSLAPASWEQRLVIWREASDRALHQCMPLGCGADYARAWRNEGATIDVPSSPVPLPVMPVHPHNVFIQIWLELGLAGAGAFLTAMIASAVALLRINVDSRTAAAICAVAAVSFISVMFEASLWQAWRLAVFALAAFGCAVSYSINKSKQ